MVKMKIGREPERDETRVKSARQAIGEKDKIVCGRQWRIHAETSPELCGKYFPNKMSDGLKNRFHPTIWRACVLCANAHRQKWKSPPANTITICGRRKKC